MKTPLILIVVSCILISGCLNEEPLITGHIDFPTSTIPLPDNEHWFYTNITPKSNDIIINNESLRFIDATPPRNIKVASWNLQRFGPKKAADTKIMNDITTELGKYDIIVLQEITDSSGKAFETLCNRMLGYKCVISERTGNSSYEEQYGVLYSNDIVLNDEYMIATNGMERFPYVLNFTSRNWTFNLVTVHTKPENTQAELMTLEYIMDSNKRFQNNTIIIGDMNADCNYYKIKTEFTDHLWLIPDSSDTTSGPTDCAYDRIIADTNIEPRIHGWGTDDSSSTTDSDHYLIYGIFNTE